MRPKNLISLGFFRPSTMTKEIIQEEFKNFMLVRGFNSEKFWVATRTPEFMPNNADPKRSIEIWHKDDEGQSALMVLWSSCSPTELADQSIMKKHLRINPVANGLFYDGTIPEEEIFRPQPYEVVVVNNAEVVHRKPKTCEPNRWFCRMSGMVSLND